MQHLDRLVRALRRLPGVGPRQAERFAAYFLRASQGNALRIAKGGCAKSAKTPTATLLKFA